MAWALRARAPVAAGSLPRATRSAPKAGALRARAPTCAPRVTAHVVSWGGVGMSKTSCAARCSRGSVQGVLRAPAEGEGGVAHREDLAATASATLERSTGTVAHGKRAARERRRRRSKVSRRRRAGHAPPARRGRRVRVPRAFKRPAKTLVVVVVVVRTPTPNYLRQASPDRGKYYRVYLEIALPHTLAGRCARRRRGAGGMCVRMWGGSIFERFPPLRTIKVEAHTLVKKNVEGSQMSHGFRRSHTSHR